MPHYTLIHTDDITPGMRLDGNDDYGDPRIVTTDPRRLHPSDDYALEDFTVEEIILGATPTPVRVARLTPDGPVRPQTWASADGEEVLHTHFVQAPAWTVEAVETLDGLMGPNAEHLTQAIRSAIWLAGDLDRFDQESPYDEEPHRAAYDHAVDALYETYGSRVPWHLDMAAERALNAYGADGTWWARFWGSCTTGGSEIPALAARDLIGTDPAWTPEAYLILTAPWRAAFGRGIHPDDPMDTRYDIPAAAA